MANSRHTGFLSKTKKAVIQHALDKRITINEERLLASIRSDDIDPSWSDFREPFLVEFFQRVAEHRRRHQRQVKEWRSSKVVKGLKG
jgi:hypothetical protein